MQRHSHPECIRCTYICSKVAGQGANDAAITADRNEKEVIFKNCAPFIDCISEINKTQIDNAKHLDIVMPMQV